MDAAVRVIVLNGGSSSGKSAIARLLQAILPEPWLALGVDDLIRAMPNGLLGASGGLVFGPGGEVEPGPAFRRLEAAWRAGVASMARSGARVILDEVFLGGAASQAPWREALADLGVLWVGVRCDPEAAALRETARGDRVAGMARAQAEAVHAGVRYDLEVDTTAQSAEACARLIVARVVAAGAPT